MTRTRLAGSILTSALVLVVPAQSGCESTGSSAGRSAIYHQWGDRISEIGYVVIVPPQEDIRVGDIYALTVSPDTVRSSSSTSRRDAAKRIAASSRWATIPVLTDLEQEYGQRRSWPKTPDIFMNPSSDPGPAWQEPVSDDHASIFAPGAVPIRLRNVALEQFASVSFSGAELETILPTEVATLVTGRAHANNLAVTMRAGSAEAYSLSVDRLLSLLLDQVSTAGQARYVLKQPYRSNLELMADATTNHVWLQVISEVMYIRSADFTIRTIQATPKDDEVTASELALVAQQSESQAAQPAQQPPATTADAAPAEAAPAEATQTPPRTAIARETRAVQKLDAIYGGYVRARAINDILSSESGDDVPSGVVHFISVTDESVALRRLWPRGLAVGVRGLILEVEASTGRVLRSGPLGQPMPYMPVTAAP